MFSLTFYWSCVCVLYTVNDNFGRLSKIVCNIGLSTALYTIMETTKNDNFDHYNKIVWSKDLPRKELEKEQNIENLPDSCK